MKRFKLLFILLVAVLLTLPAQAGQVKIGTSLLNFVKSTGAIASSENTGIGPCLFYGVWIATDGTNSVTVNVYDNTAGSGKKIIPTTIVAGSAYFGGGFVPIGVMASTGLYVAITTSGTAQVVIYYDDGNP